MFNSGSLKQKNILVWTLPPLKMFQLQLTKTYRYGETKDLLRPFSLFVVTLN